MFSLCLLNAAFGTILIKGYVLIAWLSILPIGRISLFRKEIYNEHRFFFHKVHGSEFSHPQPVHGWPAATGHDVYITAARGLKGSFSSSLRCFLMFLICFLSRLSRYFWAPGESITVKDIRISPPGHGTFSSKSWHKDVSRYPQKIARSQPCFEERILL